MRAESANRRTWIDRAAAAALTGMLVASVVGLRVENATLVAGGLAWFAAILLNGRLASRQRIIVLVLLTAGAAGMVWGGLNNHPPEWRMAITANLPLISMLAAVSFLRAVATPTTADRHQKTTSGRRGVWQTMIGVHLFGSVINLPAMDAVGDRLLQRSRLDRAHILLLSRSYSGAAFWSPFWGAAATVLTYAPAADVATFILAGGLLASIGLMISARTVITEMGPGIREFPGLPLSLRALAVPLAMVVLVIGLHLLYPEVAIVAIVMITAPLITVTLLVFRSPSTTVRTLSGHAQTNLPAMGGELALFLAAGVLVAGFIPLADSAGAFVPISTFTWGHAWALLAAMAALSALGLHPVVSIALAANLLAPVDPNPTLFAMTGLIAWGLQASAGPVSGLNVVMHGRYGVDSFTIARWNAKFVLMLFVVAGPILWLCELISS